MDKPRVSLEQYEEMMKRQSTYVPGSIADLIERFMAACPTLGLDSGYRLRKIQRHAVLGPMLAVDLKREDVIEFCQARRKEVCAATVTHDVVCLFTVFKYAGSGVWKDCRAVSAAEILAAKPFLTREGLVGKSQPRERRPAAEEVAALDAYFAKQNEHDRTKVDMVQLSRWQRLSSRRVGESCKIVWPDWAPYDQTIVVRGMKDPKRKGKIKTVALTAEASDMLWEMAYEMNERPELRTDQPRIFPYNSKTASARYTMAKIALGIENLHLHDSRRECISNLAEGGFSSQQIRMVSGHETTVILDRTYNRPDPAKFKDMQPMAAQR